MRDNDTTFSGDDSINEFIHSEQITQTRRQPLELFKIADTYLATWRPQYLFGMWKVVPIGTLERNFIVDKRNRILGTRGLDLAFPHSFKCLHIFMRNFFRADYFQRGLVKSRLAYCAISLWDRTFCQQQHFERLLLRQSLLTIKSPLLVVRNSLFICVETNKRWLSRSLLKSP